MDYYFDLLLFLLLDANHDRLSNELKKKYILDIARALEYLHSYNIVHRDVKVCNRLINELYEMY